MTKKTNKEEVVDDKSAVLELAIKSITKKYGHVIETVSDVDEPKIIPTISTGCLSLDTALGRGGMAFGRIYEIFGPNMSGKSTLADSIIVQAQRRGLKCLYIDAECAKDLELFRTYGGNVADLTLVQGHDGEENLDILEKLLKTGAFKVAIVDSVSALIPRVEAEANIEDQQMGVHARLMSKALRKINPIVNENGVLLVFINQLRMKIGSYGCFHYDTLVNFCDGQSLPIGKVVDNKITGKVWSLNELTGEIEQKEIVDWHNNGLVDSKEDFIHIQTDSINGMGRFGFTCTLEHEIYTDKGLKKAKELSFDDKLISKYEETINGTYADFLNGCLVGDSHISVRHKNTGSLRFQDSENSEYIDWKINKLSKFINFKKLKTNQRVRYDSEYLYELSKIKQRLGARDPLYFLNNYSDLGFAIWLMDDGSYDKNNGHNRYHISVKRYKNDESKLTQIVQVFNNLGYECSYSLKDGLINFKTSVTATIAGAICKYVPDCMQYKLPETYKNKYEEFSLTNTPKIKKEFVAIKEIRTSSDRQFRNRRKFDISVEGNHNYMVGGYKNGVIVHNSPETTTGGESLNFYATGRVSVRGPESKARRIENDNGDVIGHTTLFEVVKNKLSAPFRKAEVNLVYGKGYDVHWEVLKLATSVGIIDRSGAWYKYKGENFAQGEMNAALYLKDPENSEMYNTLLQQVIEQVGLKEKYEQSLNPGPIYS